MRLGSRAIAALVLKYRPALGDARLEIGPLYQPLFVPTDDEDNRLVLLKANHRAFSSVMVSQVLNYVDFRQLLSMIGELQENGGLLFTNNLFVILPDPLTLWKLNRLCLILDIEL